MEADPTSISLQGKGVKFICIIGRSLYQQEGQILVVLLGCLRGGGENPEDARGVKRPSSSWREEFYKLKEEEVISLPAGRKRQKRRAAERGGLIQDHPCGGISRVKKGEVSGLRRMLRMSSG